LHASTNGILLYEPKVCGQWRAVEGPKVWEGLNILTLKKQQYLALETASRSTK